MKDNTKYLIKLWICVSSELVAQRVWETNKNADDFIKEVTIRKEYFVPQGTITKYRLIAK